MKYYILVILVLWNNCLKADWREKNPLPRPGVGATAITFDDKIYLIGGKNLSTFFNRVDIYDPINDTWDTTSASLMPTPRANAAVVLYQNKIYVIGGRNNQGACKSVESYNPMDNSWKELRSLRGPRSGLSAITYRDSLLIFGGIDSDGFYVDKIEWYDNENNKWEKLTQKMSPPRVSMFTYNVNDTLFFSGGFYFSPLNSSMKLTPSGEWGNGPDLFTERGEGTTVVTDDSVFLIGGVTSTGTTDIIEVFETKTQMITQFENLPEPRAGQSTCIFRDSIYVFGGHGVNTSDILGSVIVYHPLITSLNNYEDKPTIPVDYQVITNYPNPFNGLTNIVVNLREGEIVDLEIYDIQGQLISKLVNKYLPAGKHTFPWSGSSQDKNWISSGVYIAVLRMSSQIYSNKMLYIK